MAATEVFSNNPATTVQTGGTDAPASGAVETWTVASSVEFTATASTGVTQFHVGDPAIPSEIILVTNMTGTGNNTWTVTRGAEGTTPVAHAPGFTIAQVVTAGWLATVSFLNPMTTAGDMIAGTLSGLGVRVPGNTSAAKKFLTQTGAGGTAQTPAWGTIATTDVSGTVATVNGGTGLGSFTSYAVITGGTASTSQLQQVSGLGSSGQVLTSNGASALPSWQPATGGSGGGSIAVPVVVGQGGTGGTQATAYAVVTGGTTATAPFQQVSGVGSSGQILTSRGAGSLPTWQTNTGGSVGTGAAGQVLTSAVPAGGGSPATGWANAPVDWVNVQTAYGAAGNGVFTTSGTITASSHTFHSSDLVPFTGSLNVWIDGAGTAGGVLSTTMTCTVTGTGTTAAAAITTATGTNALWGTDDTTAVRNAINAAPFGGVVYFPVAVYITSSPLVVPPCITLLSDGRSLAYYGGSQNMQMSNAILHPSPAFTAGAAVAAGGGTQVTLGVIEFLSQNLGGYPNGSSNQAVRNITIDGRSAPGALNVNGIEAWGPVWGVLLEYAGIYGLPNRGISANSSTPDTTGKFPDFWQMIGCHVAANGGDGVNMASISDSYFVASESTGNNGNGWTLTGDNIKITACKAEYNNGIGLSIARGGASRPILVNGFGTDGNGQNGIQIGGAGAGPVVISGAGLNYDGRLATTGALEVTGGGHVSCTGLFVTTQSLSGTHPSYGVQASSGFTGLLQLSNSEIYAATTPILNSSTAGTITTGTNVLTGTGDWSNQSSLGSIQYETVIPDQLAAGRQTLPQYAKYWTGSGWGTPTGAEPRESLPFYSAQGNNAVTAGVMYGTVIPVIPGDVISRVGFTVGNTGAGFGTNPNWWTALYTAPNSGGSGATLIAQSGTQGSAALGGASSHLLTLGAGAPYTVPAGTYSLFGAVMINTGAGGTQPTLRGAANNLAQNGGTSDLFTTSPLYSGTNGSGLGGTAPTSPVFAAASSSLMYLGAC